LWELIKKNSELWELIKKKSELWELIKKIEKNRNYGNMSIYKNSELWELILKIGIMGTYNNFDNSELWEHIQSELWHLSFGIMGSFLEIVKLILELANDKNPANNNGVTPLHRAVQNGHLDIVKLILRYANDKNPADKDDWTSWTGLDWSSLFQMATHSMLFRMEVSRLFSPPVFP
jgi:hypothetical protein